MLLMFRGCGCAPDPQCRLPFRRSEDAQALMPQCREGDENQRGYFLFGSTSLSCVCILSRMRRRSSLSSNVRGCGGAPVPECRLPFRRARKTRLISARSCWRDKALKFTPSLGWTMSERPCFHRACHKGIFVASLPLRQFQVGTEGLSVRLWISVRRIFPKRQTITFANLG